jgi:GH18 family chitinase
MTHKICSVVVIISAALTLFTFVTHINAMRHSSLESNTKRQQVEGYYSYKQYFSEFQTPESAMSSNVVEFKDISHVVYHKFVTDADGNIFGGNVTADGAVLFGPLLASVPPGTHSSSSAQQCCSHTAPHVRHCSDHFVQRGLLRRLHAEKKPVLLSIDGIGVLQDNTFVAVAANSSARREFAKNCASILLDYMFDGILLDWHYPHPEFDDWGDSIGDDHYYDDFKTYKLLLNDMYSAMQTLSLHTDKNYVLAAYLTCDWDQMQGYDFEQLSAGISFSHHTETHSLRNIRYAGDSFAVSRANSGGCMKLFAKTSATTRQ